MKRELVNERVVEHKDYKERLKNLIEVQRDCVRIKQVLVEVGLVLLQRVQSHLKAIKSLLRCRVRGLRRILCELRLQYRNLGLDVLGVLLAIGAYLVH